MSEQASGTFELDKWDEVSSEDKGDGTVVGRVLVAKTYQGDLVGTSTTELQTVTTPAGPVAYVATEHFEGTLHGHKGSFVFWHSANASGGKQWLRWVVVEGAATGDLTGLTGEGTIVNNDGAHSYTLDYTLPPSS